MAYLDSLLAGWPPLALSTFRLLIWLVLLCLIFIPLERALGQRGERTPTREWAHNVFYYFLSSLVPAIALSAPLALLGSAASAALPSDFSQTMADLPLAARIALAFLVSEIGFYWGHRLSHTLPFLWRFHAVHHSPRRMYFLVHTRAHPVDLVFTRLCGIVPLYVLGLAGPSIEGSAMPAGLIVLGAFWGFFIHADLRLRMGPLEWILATPAFHHWHHHRDDQRSCNYASTLPVLDLAFGSLRLPPVWPSAYGIDTPLSPTLAGQLADPLRAAAPEQPVRP